MIGVFFFTFFGTVSTALLVLRWHTRREQTLALRRLANRPQLKAGSRPQDPVLMQPPGETRGRMATRVLERFQLHARVERLLDTADLKWGPAGLAHRSAASALLVS